MGLNTSDGKGRSEPKLRKASAEHVLSCLSRSRTRSLEPTAGFEPATRCLQIRIYTVRHVPPRVSTRVRARDAFGCLGLRGLVAFCG